MTPAILIFVAAVLGAMGAFWAAAQSARFEKELRLKSDEISELNKKIAKKSDEIANLVTGGNSYCYVRVYFPQPGPRDIAYLGLIHWGDYPIYDIDIVIRDLNKRRELLKKFSSTQELAEKEMKNALEKKDFVNVYVTSQMESEVFNTKLATFPPGSFLMPLTSINLSKGDEHNYLVKIYSRNGTITQPIKFRKIKGSWESSTRVQKFDSYQRKFTELQKDLHPEIPIKEDYAGE